jgi:hypothetical protein
MHSGTRIHYKISLDRPSSPRGIPFAHSSLCNANANANPPCSHPRTTNLTHHAFSLATLDFFLQVEIEGGLAREGKVGLAIAGALPLFFPLLTRLSLDGVAVADALAAGAHVLLIAARKHLQHASHLGGGGG